MEIGEKLKSLRNEKDYTLKQLAQITGISISFISDIENGRRIPGLENLKKLAEGLGATNVELLIGTGKGVAIRLGNANVSKEENQSVDDEPEIRAIQRAAKNMSQVDKKKMLNMIKAAFEEAFSEDD